MTFTPYQNPSLNGLYDMLFCDNMEPYQTNNTAPEREPWATLFADRPDETDLLDIAQDRAQESRVRLLAAKRLRQVSQQQPSAELIGVVVEVALPEGLDVVAAYGDGTARYLNHGGSAIVWESPTAESNQLVANLFQHSINVVTKIGPWDGARMAPPTAGMARLSFLVSGQLYFGQGPMDVFFQDPMAGPVLSAALELMQYLTTRHAAQ
ncbi:MAG TPA: hypothetical protein PK971_06390 [Saprospiraceae bacterium]|nr:hypothetical protein [Saprospiraceae bacterium]HND87933.1 hypothetical protein [Saprospiraceae bacterium]HNG90831.1 hypothetical protein [Saprospiraceae bacterium]